MSPRYSVVGKSPLTKSWGDANSGGDFGPTLKFAGYDAVLISGVAPTPTYLLIENGNPELRPAGELWGLDCVETEEALQARHGADARLACIGPAGERLALIACIINDRGRAAGRSGLGAVMGSKKLKAVVVRGDREPSIAEPAQVESLRKEYLPLFGRPGTDSVVLREYGTSGYTKRFIESGRTPIKNWIGGYPDDFPDSDAVNGPGVCAYEVRKYGCWRCNQVCGGIVRWESGSQIYEGHRPEYETLATLGTYCGIDDLETIMNMNEMCNRAGLDTISAGAVLAFAIECSKNGLIAGKELNGLKLDWGNGTEAIALLQRIINRDGLGDLLADGVRQASVKLGRGSEVFAMHAGGQELPAHDPRDVREFGLAYQISPTPGRHTQGGIGISGPSLSPADMSVFDFDTAPKTKDPESIPARVYATLGAWLNVQNAAGLCAFGAKTMGFEYVPKFISAITGWDFDMAECIKAGERIEVMRHLFNLKHGYNPLQTKVPSRAMGKPPLEKGPNTGVIVEVESLRTAYLELMEWDPVTALPSRRRLKELELDALRSE